MNLSALTYSNFRIYLMGNIFAVNGLWMQRITIGWLGWELTGSASFVGLVSFTNFAPTIFAGPFFGVLVDRIKVRRAAMITQSGLFVMALLFFVSFVTGALGPAILLILSGLTGLAAAAHNPVRMSLAPRLVEATAVSSVISMTAINFNLARLTGPAIGGWLIAVWGVGASLLIQALCYLPFICALFFINPRERSNSGAPNDPFWYAMLVGFRYVWTTPLIRQAIVITGIFGFITRGVLEVLPVLADGIFSKGAGGLGLLTAASGFGALIAGIAKAVLPAQRGGRLPRQALVCTLIGIAMVPLVGLSTSWPVSIGLIACLGFTATMTGVSMQTAIQMDLTDGLRGRVMSLWILVGIGSAACGAIMLGVLTDALGFATALGVAGLIGMALLARLALRAW